MNFPQEEIAKIVTEVLDRLGDKVHEIDRDCRCPTSGAARDREAGGRVAFGDVESAVSAAERAQKTFQEMGLEKRREIIQAIRKAGIANAKMLAQLAVEETGMGRCEDKAQKNLLVSTKTPGVEDLHSRSYTGDQGLTLVEYAPFGVVAAVTPSTNPTSTIINNTISILAAGNAVVFAPHPATQRCCQAAMHLLDEAVTSVQGPANLITTIAPSTHETTRALLAHPRVRLNLVTGGPAIVKLALTIGKICKTIAAGPGNPPVVVDDTALFPKCAQDIITGASFDNCVLCTGEKEVIVTQAARDRFLGAMRADPRAYELSGTQMDALASKMVLEGGVGCPEPRLNREFVGKNPSVIARAIGLDLPDSIRLLWGVVPNDHSFVWTEQLMPVLPVTVARDVDRAIDLAVKAEGGQHHTAAMHSMNVDHLTRMARRMQCSIYVKNAPTLYGLGLGEGYATMSIGTPTGDGLTKASHFVRPLHCSLVGYFRIA